MNDQILWINNTITVYNMAKWLVTALFYQPFETPNWIWIDSVTYQPFIIGYRCIYVWHILNWSALSMCYLDKRAPLPFEGLWSIFQSDSSKKSICNPSGKSTILTAARKIHRHSTSNMTIISSDNKVLIRGLHQRKWWLRFASKLFNPITKVTMDGSMDNEPLKCY